MSNRTSTEQKSSAIYVEGRGPLHLTIFSLTNHVIELLTTIMGTHRAVTYYG